MIDGVLQNQDGVVSVKAGRVAGRYARGHGRSRTIFIEVASDVNERGGVASLHIGI